jgi:hypothetical protein
MSCVNIYLHKKFGTVLINVTWLINLSILNTFYGLIKITNGFYKSLNNFDVILDLIVDLGTPNPYCSLAT